MLLTVAICTWNRFELLRQTLDQLTQLAIPTGVDWELLVVNNNSTDATDDLLKSFEAKLPLRSVFESTAGLSHARNRAVGEARGEYMLWTDDDVLVDEKWMAEYHEAFRTHPDAAIFGGLIEPWFAGNPPAWLPRVMPHVASAYATRDLGSSTLRLTHQLVPYGANYAIRTREQSQYLYDPNLGVRPGGAMGGEETTVVRRMLADGKTGWWVPTAKVRHYIPESRQSTRYLRRYFMGYGEYCGLLGESNGGACAMETPTSLRRKALTAEAKFFIRRFTARPEIWIEDLINASEAWGRLRGSSRRAKEANNGNPTVSEAVSEGMRDEG